MATCFDVAAYILSKNGPMSAMKLQKLVYYCQAWSLVWDEQPLFSEEIQAWANGPVVRDLYTAHSKQFEVSSISQGNESALSQDQRETVDAVLQAYGGMTAQRLSDLTHKEDPWKTARGMLAPGERGSNAITNASMHLYYSGLAK